jgi:hypothetical protein
MMAIDYESLMSHAETIATKIEDQTLVLCAAKLLGVEYPTPEEAVQMAKRLLALAKSS